MLNDGNTVYCDVEEEARLSLECIASLGLDEMNELIKRFDMHIPDSSSVSYDDLDTPTFRVVSGQFPQPQSLPLTPLLPLKTPLSL